MLILRLTMLYASVRNPVLIWRKSQTWGLRSRKCCVRVRIINTPVILCNVIFSYYNICKKDQLRYIYNSVHTVVMRLETGYIIINNAFIIRRSDVLHDATSTIYIYIYIHFIYIFIYIYLYFSLQFIYNICSYIFIFIYLYAFIDRKSVV